MNDFKESQSNGLPYEAMITKLLETSNVDTIGETIDSSNQNINYTSLKDMKVFIKHGKLMDDSVVEEEDLEEIKYITISKIKEICQSIVRNVEEIKIIIAMNYDSYGNE